jgi:hypothetical protein
MKHPHTDDTPELDRTSEAQAARDQPGVDHFAVARIAALDSPQPHTAPSLVPGPSRAPVGGDVSLLVSAGASGNVQLSQNSEPAQDDVALMPSDLAIPQDLMFTLSEPSFIPSDLTFMSSDFTFTPTSQAVDANPLRHHPELPFMGHPSPVPTALAPPSSSMIVPTDAAAAKPTFNGMSLEILSVNSCLHKGSLYVEKDLPAWLSHHVKKLQDLNFGIEWCSLLDKWIAMEVSSDVRRTSVRSPY